MPAALEEIEEAEAEGIVVHAGFGPKQVIGRDGRVTGLETLKTKWVFDASGRFNPAFHDNSESVIECDTVILAIGQTTKLDFLAPEDGVQVSPPAPILVHPRPLPTTAAGVFPGGASGF